MLERAVARVRADSEVMRLSERLRLDVLPNILDPHREEASELTFAFDAGTALVEGHGRVNPTLGLIELMIHFWTLLAVTPFDGGFAPRWRGLIRAYAAALSTVYNRRFRQSSVPHVRASHMLVVWAGSPWSSADPWWTALNDLTGEEQWVADHLPCANAGTIEPERYLLAMLASDIRKKLLDADELTLLTRGKTYTRQCMREHHRTRLPQLGLGDLLLMELLTLQSCRDPQVATFIEGALSQLLWLAAASGAWATPD